MFRYYYKKSISESYENTPENYVRYDGGWWYSEESQDGLKRNTFKIKKRDSTSNNSIFEVIEVLDANDIPSKIVSKSSIVYTILKTDSQVSLQLLSSPVQQPPSHELPVSQQQEQLPSLLAPLQAHEAHLVLSGSLELDLPEWVLQELGPQYTQELSLLLANRSAVKPDHGSQSFHLQHQLQHPLPQGGYPLQKQQQPQLFDGKIPAFPQQSSAKSFSKQHQAPSQQPLVQVLSSSIPKGVQIGSLYPPTLLPDELLPRKSLRHQKVSRQPHLLNRSQVKEKCQIDPSLS